MDKTDSSFCCVNCGGVICPTCGASLLLTAADHMDTSYIASTMPPWPLQLSPVTASIVTNCGLITSTSCGLITNTSCRRDSQQCQQLVKKMELSQTICAVQGDLQHLPSLSLSHTHTQLGVLSFRKRRHPCHAHTHLTHLQAAHSGCP